MSAFTNYPDTNAAGIPIVNIQALLDYDSNSSDKISKESFQREAAKAANGLRDFGVLIIKDPRVTHQDNNRFLDMLEEYFEQPESAKMPDTRPQYSYQVGATPSLTELPRNHCDRMKAFKDTNKPLSICPPEKDPKWRFFWRIGDRPVSSKYAGLNADAVTPASFPQWKEVMDSWGSKLLQCVTQVSELAAVGFGLERDSFSKLMKCAPHLLAPTATDFNRFGKKGTVAAGFHYDLNFLTIHGKSRFPGLFIWTRQGNRILVRVPDGCLLVQAGKQFEYLTGGHVLAGYHEVVVVDETVEAIERAKAEDRSIWRISSTLFGHIASDNVLKPLGKFGEDPEVAEKYPPIDAGEQVLNELKSINLASTEATD